MAELIRPAVSGDVPVKDDQQLNIRKLLRDLLESRRQKTGQRG